VPKSISKICEESSSRTDQKKVRGINIAIIENNNSETFKFQVALLASDLKVTEKQAQVWIRQCRKQNMPDELIKCSEAM
jgi:hypothetical protein